MRKTLALLGIVRAILAQEVQPPTIDTVVANHQFIDGPAWSPDGFLVFSDLPTNRLLKIGSDGVSILKEKTEGANGNAFDDKGRLYTCESSARRVIRTDKKGKLEVLAERFEGKRFNGPNDLAVSKSGHVYFTDPAFGKQADSREMSHYGVYHISPKGEISLVAKPLGRPNGIALTHKGDKLYVTNSDEKNVRVYDIGKDGVPANEQVLITKIDGVPSGIETDETGRLYVAARDVLIYSPQGKHLLNIHLAESPSNLVFSDPHTLYVTARGSVYRLRWALKGAEGN